MNADRAIYFFQFRGGYAIHQVHLEVVPGKPHYRYFYDVRNRWSSRSAIPSY